MCMPYLAYPVRWHVIALSTLLTALTRRISVSWCCDHRASISLGGRISADIACAGCRRVERTVKCEEHTHCHAILLHTPGTTYSTHASKYGEREKWRKTNNKARNDKRKNTNIYILKQIRMATEDQREDETIPRAWVKIATQQDHAPRRRCDTNYKPIPE